MRLRVQMYAGALLATAARLAWDPSTYAWLRWLCEAQYRASAAFVLAAALLLALLVCVAALALHPPPHPARALHIVRIDDYVLSKSIFLCINVHIQFCITATNSCK